MDPRDTILLCLGDFPVPIISATPGSVIPWNDSVKILCWGTPESYLYQLEILGNSTFEVVEKKLGFQKKAEFLIKHMNPNTAGRYQCQYRKQDHWSEHSKALELVVTGFYNKPFFSADQGIVVMLGKNISLQCRSAHIPFDRFSLIKEGGATLSQNQNGRHQGTFILGPVNQSFSGNYRCYDIMKQDYTVGNLIRMGVAGLVLVALLAILVKNWHNHQAPNKEDCPDLSELSWSKQKCQT
ncbi:immunoglobulin alpha Fc receptor isoform X4 [Mirounga angustirostris]|uniref:immunoglobulin alpha Fc receptor isoform X4 n=1 Tax=Mirounga angustirostris TaxID=9716 RepID=UPI0023E425C5|nr:immunoglobulin alpha Fc receptor-like isoform X4 [Mirounga angustirostris]